jgi:hypothetical protein
VHCAVFYLALTAFWVAGALAGRRRAEEAARRELEAREATAAERSRIARELHDAVTHHVTAVIVQGDAAQFLSAAPERIAESLAAIGGTGRRALAELRYLLGVLAATGESAPARRTPALGTLHDLVEQTRLAGQPVEFVEEGERAPLTVAAEPRSAGHGAGQAGPVSQNDGVDPGAQIQLGEDAGYVGFHRLGAEHHLGGDLGVREPAADERQRLALAGLSAPRGSRPGATARSGRA